jgi:hypothetical protein
MWETFPGASTIFHRRVGYISLHKNNSNIASTSSNYGRGEIFYRNASRCCDFLFVTLLLVSQIKIKVFFEL